MRMRSGMIGVGLALVPSLVAAQQRPAVRQLGPIVAKFSDALASLGGLRSLSNGSVLVNDITGRRLLLLDAGLSSPLIIADSTSATASAYSGRTAGLIPYRADSSIFVDPNSMSMLVIDPSGKIARVMSVPRTQDAFFLGGPLAASVGFDPVGRLIYRGSPFNRVGGSLRRRTEGGAAGFAPPDIPDSTPIVRIDLATRKLDTLAFGKIPKIKFDVVQNDNGITITSQVNPLPTVDDFAVLPDGSLAMLRGQDYHVDYIAPDGTKTSTPKIPFDWQRLTDEDKVAFIDSLKVARARQDSANPTGGGGTNLGGAAGGGGGTPQIVVNFGGGGGGGRRPGPGGAPAANRRPQINFVPPSELPDYKPAFFAGSTKADAQGRLWVRTIPTKKIEGGPVYDVIDRKGALVDRVQVPANTTIAGFAADGGVYLALQSGSTVYLEKATPR